jgi:hypothetical protein
MTDELLFLTARVLLRTCSPGTAHIIMLRLGALFAAKGDAREVAEAVARLGRRGTCLSRSLAVAARAPTAEIVIGVSPNDTARFIAHAWLEIQGIAVDQREPQGIEIARLRSR